MQSPHPLESGIHVLRALITQRTELDAEFRASRSDFFQTPGGTPAATSSGTERLLADRRHLEWFAFERDSKLLGDIPAVVLFDEWMASSDVDSRVFGDALLHSRTGVFEVKSVESGVGFWLEDLLGHGAFPVDDPEASRELQAGDLLAGRLFPIGESQFRLSPAVAVYRNARLVEALRGDLARLRAERPKTLRISQAEIERMFFTPNPDDSEASPADAPDPSATPADSAAIEGSGDVADEDAEALLERAREQTDRARQLLSNGGIDSEAGDDWLAQLAASSHSVEDSGAVISAILERAAFESDVDLEELRRSLHETRGALLRAANARKADVETHTLAPQPPPVQAPDTTAPETTSTDDESDAVDCQPEDVAAALADFDAGRAAGRPLDELFGALERELGLGEDEGDDDGVAPDFPGVVGAVIVEFLWECERENAAVAPAARACLLDLAERQRELGVFEELDVEHLVEFIASWSIDTQRLGSAYSAVESLDAIERFCRWAESDQHVPLWTAFRRRHKDLAENLARVVDANQTLSDVPAGTGVQARGEVRELEREFDSQRLGANDSDGHFLPLELTESQAPLFAAGDGARLETSGQSWKVLRLYPHDALTL